MARPNPFGGFARGLAAVTAVALVAVAATTLLRQPAWQPAQLARATDAPAIALAPAAAPRPAATAPQSEAAAQNAVEPSSPTAAAARQEAPAALAAQPTAAPTLTRPAPAAPPPTSAPTAVPRAVAPTAVPAPTSAAEKSGLAVAPAPTSPAADQRVGATAVGGGPAAPVIPPAPALPSGPALPAGVKFAYADGQALWAVEGAAGPRRLAEAAGLTAPLISPDGAWVAYRAATGESQALRAVRWDGTGDRLALAERELPTTGLPEGYGARRLNDAQWQPGVGQALILRTVAAATTAGKLPVGELWRLDVTTGALRPLLQLGVGDPIAFAPDGGRLAVLRLPAANREGSLALRNADSGAEQVVLRLPAVAAAGGTPRLGWLADGSALWATVPMTAGLSTAYRIAASGPVSLTVADLLWSPDGGRLAYTRPISGTPGQVLLLAGSDGGAAAIYATLRDGQLISWAPDAAHFLYSDLNQVYLGAAPAAPRSLGPVAAIFDPRWIAPDSILHLSDQGSGWTLVLRGLDGQTATLLTLPRDITYDVAPH
jgi:hypothetical protein